MPLGAVVRTTYRSLLVQLGKCVHQPATTGLRQLSSGDSGNISPSLVRNVGIVAHIDAGKTTATERMLYYAGFTQRMGDVDDGDTVMDYLQQERERGITINSATVTFLWKGHRINLIDTPGHVDFTFEVERSLRVLDGAVALFDASVGVEAQTISVWKQADRYHIPRIAYINKLDKPTASLPLAVESMRLKLSATPLVVQLPLGEGRAFRGVVDLVSMNALLWKPGSDGAEYSQVALVKPSPRGKDFQELACLLEQGSSLPVTRRELASALEARAQLAEQVLTLDSDLLGQALAEAGDSFSPLTISDELLRKGLRRLTQRCDAVPVLCGSALRNTAIQPLMDAVTIYLPAPNHKPMEVPAALRQLCAYAFKVTHDTRRGPLVYLRVQSGSIRAQSLVYNLTRSQPERVTRVLLMLADQQQEVPTISEGNIAVAVGLKHTITGDTLVQSEAAAKALKESGQSAPLVGLEAAPPVFFCSVEPASASHQKALDHALSCLAREDPSLRVSTDKDTGQTILSGMGELHLEVALHRLRHNFRVDCSLGSLQVAYREAPTSCTTHSASLERNLAGRRQTVSVTLQLGPANSSTRPSASLARPVAMAIGSRRKEVEEAVRNGVESACSHGPLLGFPVHDVGVEISDITLPSTSMALLSACVADCTSKALKATDVQLLEPFMHLEVSVPEEQLGVVLGELTSNRRGQVCKLASQDGNRVIVALVPLASLMGVYCHPGLPLGAATYIESSQSGSSHENSEGFTVTSPIPCTSPSQGGYSTALRTMTSGTGSFVSSFAHYQPVTTTAQADIIQQLRGYLL